MSGLDPIILFFLFGVAAGLARSELRLPSQIYDFVSMVLLLTIGLKGGVELNQQPFLSLLPQILIVALAGFLIPFVLYPILKSVGRFSRADSASIAAHYGSVSVGTFAVAVAYLGSLGIEYEQHMALFVVILEIPAILIGVILAKGLTSGTRWGKVSHEVFLGKGVLLLVGGLVIGWISGPERLSSITPLFFDLFHGVLALFLLEMGLIASYQIGSLRKHGLFLACFGIVVPLILGVVGAVMGHWLGFSAGGAAILATLFASCSYIAVPAAMRISVPEANPTLSLAASLGVTFPFNIIIGIPLYYQLSTYLEPFLG